MTEATKRAISRGIKKANIRKRMSKAMIESWERRRQDANNETNNYKLVKRALKVEVLSTSEDIIVLKVS